MKKNKGFSLIEIVVVLAIMGVIAAFLTPMLFNYMSESKSRRAQNDVQQIANVLGKFNADTGIYPIYSALPLQKDSATVLVLVTDGLNAQQDSPASGWNCSNSDGALAFEESTTGSSLRYHLENGKLALGNAEYNGSGGVQKPNKWAGPYMTDFKADPWGTKYYVSTEGLKPGSTKAAFVLSAGPNATIETSLSQNAGTATAGTTNVSVGGDDIAFRIK